MTDKKSSVSRRKLLKSIAAGSGAIVTGKSLPESWSRPVVDSVMLPAHAQTSPATPVIPGTPSLGYSTNQFTLVSLEPGVQEFFITTAHAGFVLNNGILVVVFQADLTSYDAWFQENTQGNNQAYIGSGTGTTETTLDAQCSNNDILLTLNSGPNAGGIGFSFYRSDVPGDVFTGTVMPDDAPPSPPDAPC